jgi:hypothetical protein
VGTNLQDDAADQVGINAPRRLDLATGGSLDLPEQLRRLLVGQLDRSRELGVDDALVLCHQALELARDLPQLRGAALVREEEQEVAEQLVSVA